MSRLIAFGCSNSFGEALEDCHPCTDWSSPSKHAWPQILGNLLGKEVVNLAKAGESNKAIWNHVVSFDYQDDDVVFIHWTSIDRTCVFGKWPKIGPWMVEKKWRSSFNIKNHMVARIYYKEFYSVKDRIKDFYIRTDHAKRYLDSKNIKNYHFSCNNGSDDFLSSQPHWTEVKFDRKNILSSGIFVDLALDQDHPGPQSHINFANYIIENI